MSTVISFNSDNVGKVNKLGIRSEDHSNRAYEPQTQNTFTFQFLFDPGQVAYIATSANRHRSDAFGGEDIPTNNYADGLAKINEILNSSLQGITSPTKNIGQIVIDYFNTQVKFAGKPTYSNANITLNTLIGLGTKNILAAWSDICLNDKTLAGGWARSLDDTVAGNNLPQRNQYSNDDDYLNALFPLIGYKCDGLLLECARDGTIVNQWEYIGMWLQTFTPGSYTMAGANTPSQVSGTIVVDLIRQATTKYVKSEITERYS